MTSLETKYTAHIHAEGEKSEAICYDCGRVVQTTFVIRDVPFDDGIGIARAIMACVCDGCGEVVAIPAMSTPQIAAARREALAEIEAARLYPD